MPIYYMENAGGVGFNPTDYVDISEEMELKTRMLECHESQVVWLRDHDGEDVVANMKTSSRFRGMQCGVKYAEGFVQCRAYLKGTTKRLLP